MCVVVDSSVLINFLCVDRMDLIGHYPGLFFVTKAVVKEVARHGRKRRYVDQEQRYQAALDANHLAGETDFEGDESKIFKAVRKHSDVGESSAIAVALNRNYRLATDDKNAIKHAHVKACSLGKNLSVLRTQDIIWDLITYCVLTTGQAHDICSDLKRNYRFNIPLFTNCHSVC